MADCEMCGEEDAEFLVSIEGARLNVCARCARHGKILRGPEAQAAKKQVLRREEPELDLVRDYGARIHKARDRMKIGREVLAELISEKESFLERIENERTRPSEELARKLERELGIVLLEKSLPESGTGEGAKSKGITLGDIAFVKKKKSQESEE